jgi:hypothetical protein
VLSAPAPGPTLRDVLAEWQTRGQPGVPRARALAYLRPVADALHELAARTGVYHLALSPRCLQLAGDRVSIADFGLAHLLWLPAGQSILSFNARYSAPELAHRQAGPACDQYSLALIYHELLTGTVPAPGWRARGANVDRLPEGDRPVIARALRADPRRRWGSLVELFDALEALGPGERIAPPEPAARSGPAGLHMRFGTSLGPALIRERLESFRQQWKAERVGGDDREALLRMPAPRSLWRRGADDDRPALQVRLAVGESEAHPLAGVQACTEVRMDLRPCDGPAESSRALLGLIAPLLVESLRNHLRLNRGRSQERVVWHHPLRVCAMGPDGGLGAPIDCQGKDISLNGIGFYLPGEVPSAQVMLLLPATPQTLTERVPARIVRARGCGNGWSEVGAVLLPEE